MFKFFRDLLDKEAERPRLAYCAPILLILFLTFGDQYLGKIFYSHNPSIQKPHEQLKDQLTAMYQELELMPNTEFKDIETLMRSHTGSMYFSFETEHSLEDVVEYYDKEFKNKGWVFQEIKTEKGGTKSFNYTKRRHSIGIYYFADIQEENKTKFSIFVKYY